MQIIQYWRHNDTNTIKRVTYLFKHSLSSWFFKQLRGSSWLQWEHSVGSSDMAFSTAKLREQILRFISVRQFGQVDCSFFSRLSAKRCVKQDAHIRCPLRHYVETEKKLMSKSYKICIIILIFKWLFTHCGRVGQECSVKCRESWEKTGHFLAISC